MRSRLFLKLFFLLFSMTQSVIAIAQNKIAFDVSFSEPQAHYADIKMEISGLKRDFVDIKMPVWAPGSYLVREFSKNVENVAAVNQSGDQVSIKKINKNTWRINSTKSEKITVSYKIYAFEISVRTSFVDAAHAFLSPTGVFMYVDGLIKNPVTVTIKPYSTWSKISTGMEPQLGSANTFYAPDFDILYDSPIEIGNQDIFQFDAAGVKHEVAMYGGGNYDKERLKIDMAKIAEEETKIFGENPNKRYVFIIHNFTAGGGGIEHLNSTVLGASRFAYGSEAGYKGFLGLVAHEYFHLWNVKRLRPKALGPFDYDQENYTTNLWIAEGFTSYFDNMVLQRAGFNSPDQYLANMANTISAVENQPGGRVLPVSEASFDAWIRYYRPNENSGNSGISYYDKGEVLGMLFDLEILNATKGEKGLDDVMKAMYDEYYKKLKRGYTDEEFRAMAEKIAGKSLDKIYNEYVNGTQLIDLNTYASYAGLRAINDNAGKSEPYFGIAASAREGKIFVSNVSRGSAAWKFGLNTNDELIAINNQRISSVNDPASIISTKKVGDKINVTVARDGILQTLELTLGANPNIKYRFEALRNASAEQLAVRKNWL